jgi:integrase/recombinase XerD
MAKNIQRIKKREPEEFIVTVEEAVDEYLASIKRLRPSTQREYQYKLGLFVRWCKVQSVYLRDVSAKIVDMFLDDMKKTHKPCKAGKTEISSSTLASQVRIIKIFLNWCLEDEQYGEYVKPTVVKRIKNIKVIQEIIDTFSPEQIEALFRACDKEISEHLQLRDRAIVALLVDTGIRASELIGLTMGNVSLNPRDAYIRVFGKGGKWGEVGLGDRARRALGKYIRTFREPTIEHQIKQREMRKEDKDKARVFVGHSGDQLTANGLHQTIERLGKWAHIKDVRCSPHTFRHTFSRMFMENGGDIYKLSKLLRHTSVKTTEEYLKTLQHSEVRKGAKSVLDNL